MPHHEAVRHLLVESALLIGFEGARLIISLNPPLGHRATK